ncbi:MAG TPA: hypothetical protein VLM05_05900, partial [Mycobacteriales bacterium]|nr:hypothetical protein [Mycobacteriales bacterium]
MTTSQRERAGTLLGGRYRLIEPLPGAGRTWRAQDEIDGRDLAARILRLPDGLPEDQRQQIRQRAFREAAVVARSQHPGVAHVVDAVVEDGVPWVISVLPAGRTLSDLVRLGGPMPPDVAALIGLQVLDALVAAGVPHGDLTPDDVVIGANGRVVVTGFATTPAGATVTPGFGPPEGGGGRTGDLWALGVTLHVVTEGRMPGGQPPATSALRPVLDGLLDPEPGRRPDLDAVRRMLGLVAGEPDAPVEKAAPPPDINDPEVAAALAAFDAALGRPRTDAPAPRTEPDRRPGAAEARRSAPPPEAIPWTVPAPRPEPRVQSAPDRTEVAPASIPAPAAAPAAPERQRRHLGAGLAFLALLAVIAAVLVPVLTGRGDDDRAAAPPLAAFDAALG